MRLIHGVIVIIVSSCTVVVVVQGEIQQMPVENVFRNNTIDNTSDESEFSLNVNKNTINESAGIHVVTINWNFVKRPLILCTFVFVLILVILCLHHIKHVSKIIPESCALIVIGVLLGILILFDTSGQIKTILTFNKKTFFLILLPPIILDAAYSLRDRAFMENFWPILIYAVLGTILNVILISAILLFCIRWSIIGSMQCSYLHILIFSSLISAVDPVAVLAIFNDVGVNKMLYFMVFGESLLNDAVTIVMYKLSLDMTELPRTGFSEIAMGFLAFLCVALGGMFIGMFFGFLSAYITKFTSSVQYVEPIVLFTTAYLAYFTAELFHWSGIISIIACGIAQAQYTFENIDKKSAVTVKFASECLSKVMESLIFLILGAMIVDEPNFWHSWNTSLSVLSLCSCIIVRYAVTFILTAGINSFTLGSRKIQLREQLIIGFGGLRGAISYSLAFMLDSEQMPNRDSFLAATYFVVLFTVFVQGIAMKPLVKMLNIALSSNPTHNAFHMFLEFDRGVKANMMAGIEQIVGTPHSRNWLMLSQWISQRFIRPALQKSMSHKSKLLVAFDLSSQTTTNAVKELEQTQKNHTVTFNSNTPTVSNLSKLFMNPVYNRVRGRNVLADERRAVAHKLRVAHNLEWRNALKKWRQINDDDNIESNEPGNDENESFGINSPKPSINRLLSIIHPYERTSSTIDRTYDDACTVNEVTQILTANDHKEADEREPSLKNL